MIYFTADLHLGHEKILRYCNRPFQSIQEMDETIIYNWNHVVKKEDVGYILGDFAFGNPIDYYKRLNGIVYIVPGSHDRKLKKLDQRFILPPLYTLKYNKQIVVLCHYALRTFYHSYYGAFNLYGHSHGRLTSIGRSMDVGVDTNDFYPYSYDEIYKKLSKIEFNITTE